MGLSIFHVFRYCLDSPDAKGIFPLPVFLLGSVHFGPCTDLKARWEAWKAQWAEGLNANLAQLMPEPSSLPQAPEVYKAIQRTWFLR